MTGGRYDYVVVGAGHNGLTAASYLARARRKVLVLERRPFVGGSAVTEEFRPGFRADAVWAGGSLRPDIVRDLDLERHGYPNSQAASPFVSLLEADPLTLDGDPATAADSIRRFSAHDAARWSDFVRFMNRAAALLAEAYATIMPRLPGPMNWRDGLGLAELGLDLRLMGRRDMLKLIRLLPMTAAEFLEEWFECEELKAALASIAVHGATLGPMSAGTGFTLLHNWMNRGGLAHANVGHSGAISDALARAVTANGGEIRLEAPVERILVDTYTCKGVILAGGEEIPAKAVVSAVDPKRTFLAMVGAPNLPPEFVWKAQSIKMRGSVAKLHLLTDGRHGVPAGTLVVAPSIPYLEQAYDAAKYGGFSRKPYLEVTSSGRVVSIHVQFAAYSLRDSNWTEARQTLQDLTINTLTELLPGLPSSITDVELLAPPDLEERYALTEGDLNHGQLMLDQILLMRPMPGWANHRTPIDNLYLGGSGVHGGGGVSGAAGRNAARVALRER